MKTSNKILLGIISIIGLSLFSVLVFAKSSLINYEDNMITGNGKIVKINHEIAEISFFRLRGQYEVYVKEGAPALIIETDENIHDFFLPHDDNHIVNKVGDETITKRELRIEKLADVSLSPSQGIKIYVSTPSLEGINLGGNTRLTFEAPIEKENFTVDIEDFCEVDLKLSTPHLKVDARGNSTLKVQGNIGETKIESEDFSEVNIDAIEAQHLSIDASGNTNITTSGNIEEMNIQASDFANIKAAKLNTKNTIIKASGNASIAIAAIDKLDVNASGFANVNYSGDPEISKNLSRNASLNPLEH